MASLYLVSLSLLYLFVALHTPIYLIPNAGHDDGLFLALGRSIAEGRWLGSFNQFTLMKGPGYPAFLALNHWIGTPATLSHALLHVAAVLFFVVVLIFFYVLFFLALYGAVLVGVLRYFAD